MPTDMNLDAGDIGRGFGKSVTLDAGSNDVSAGDCVKFDGSGDITPTTGNEDNYVGVVLPTLKSAPRGESDFDNKYTVHTAGLGVAVRLDGAASAGDTLVPSGTNDGNWEAYAGGMYNGNPDTGADPVAANHPFVLEDGTDGDVVLAVFR